MFFVYALYNKKHNKIYIGQTVDLQSRVLEHNDPTSDKHTYTKSFDGLRELVYKEDVKDCSTALTREKQLKSFRGREFIKNLI